MGPVPRGQAAPGTRLLGGPRAAVREVTRTAGLRGTRCHGARGTGQVVAVREGRPCQYRRLGGGKIRWEGDVGNFSDTRLGTAALSRKLSSPARPQAASLRNVSLL